ncbi:MAG: transglycosylase SLT domain-containing protein [Thermoanaerobaculia bacterium]
MTSRSWLLPAVVLSAACAATTPPPKTAPRQSAASEVHRYTTDLKESYEHIVAREHTAPGDVALQADIEAAVSIDVPQHRSIDSAVHLFSGRLRDDIQSYFNRSARYRAAIDKVLAEYHLPKALGYLPVIESGYSPTLTSRAGAHGIWQFMSETAREYGLRIDWWIDERADPDRAARAAAEYLSDLHREFGDWSLALAAYNCGSARVRRALDNNGATTFWELYDAGALPKETRGYVPTFFATVLIASDPAAYGFRLPAPSADDAAPVMIEGPVSLEYIASVAEIDESVLREMNPALKRGIVPPGRVAVRVPARAAATIAPHATTLKNDDGDVAVCALKLRSGDTIKRIARALGTSPDTIFDMNGSRSFREGDTVFLPVRGRDLGPLLAAGDTFYAVRKGDTLYSIAKRHGLTVAELRDLNGLDRNEKIHAGERLRVVAPRAVTAGGM